ncbi:hypothetical protein MKZ38_007464 [Zalerion maritima]|uniref:Uncharacterized protein n=1 Tax=Zalerion maritima TaxID=339359 RepID=A0AAD5RIW2_9PEZI|nr:hypothetical protein MKZ38_007464 [Zalerion maritima]
MSGISSWLQRQRKGDLVELATSLGINDLDGKRKGEIEAELEDFLAENAATLSSDPRLSGYYNTRRMGMTSPVKREAPAPAELRIMKRRTTKASTTPVEPEPSPSTSAEEEDTSMPVADTSAASTALTRTPGRTLSLASRIPLPATPADVAQAVDRSTTAVRNRMASMYAESKIPNHVTATRQTLSTVTSILFSVAAFEMYFLRKEILADRYAFTIPAVEVLGTNAYPISLPDMFLLVTSSFWYPALTWTFTSLVGPCLLGYFFNLSAAASSSSPRGRGRLNTSGSQPEHVIDPVTFSVAKALLSYVVYKQGVTFGGWIDPVAISRINDAVYGGWQGVLAGTAITGLASMYDAVLRK